MKATHSVPESIRPSAVRKHLKIFCAAGLLLVLLLPVVASAEVLVQDDFTGSVGATPDAAKFEWAGQVGLSGAGQLSLSTDTSDQSWLRSKAGAAPGSGDTLVLQMRAYAYAENWNPGVYGDKQPRGLRVGSDADNAVEFYSASQTSVGMRVRKNGVESAATFASAVDTMHDYEILVTTTSAVFKVDGTVAGTFTANIPTGALNVYVSTWDGGGVGNVPVSLDSLSLSLTNDAVAAPLDFTWTTNVGAIIITGYTGPGGTVNIPDTITGLRVTSIGGGAFQSCASLTNVIISSNVTNISDWAFSYCPGLISATIPHGVISIGNYAFAYSGVLTDVTIGDSVTTIGYRAFCYCSGMTNIFIPGSVTSIGNAAFGWCSGLTAITVDASNAGYFSSVEGVLFNKDQTALLQYPTGKSENGYAVPNGVTSIGEGAFGGCTHLTGITIPNSVTSLGWMAFYSSSGLTNIIIPAGVNSIGGYAFVGCSSLTGVYFQGAAPSPGLSVFSGINTTIYHLSGAADWPPVPDLWAGQPTALWNPNAAAWFSVATNGAVMNYAFDGSNFLVGVEAPCTNYALLTSSNGIGAQLMSTNGTKIGPLITVARSGIATCVAFDGTNYLLIWEDDNFGACYNTGGFQVYGQFISKAGAAVGSPFAISTASIWFDGIRTMAFGGGKYLVTYTELIDPALGGDSNNRYIAGRMVAPNGTMGSEFRISTGYGDASDVAFDGTNFFVVWCEDSLDTEIRGRFVSPAGVPGTEISVNASAAASDNPKSVAFDGKNYLVVWNDEVGGKGTYTWDVFGQLVSPGGALVGGVITICNDPGPQVATSVASDGSHYLVVWVDMQNATNWDLYGQYVNQSGSLFSGKMTISTDLGNQMGGVGFADGKFGVVVNSGVIMGDGGISQVDSASGTFFAPPQNPQVLTGDASFGVRTNRFCFNITGYSNVVVVVDACTNLASGIWIPLQTNTLTGGSAYFGDSQWTNYPGRFYRLRLP